MVRFTLKTLVFSSIFAGVLAFFEDDYDSRNDKQIHFDWFGPSHYTRLGVSQDATKKEIRAAFRKLAIKYHPDKHPHDLKANAYFIKINQAYDTLSDSNSRGNYDNAYSAKVGFLQVFGSFFINWLVRKLIQKWYEWKEYLAMRRLYKRGETKLGIIDMQKLINFKTEWSSLSQAMTIKAQFACAIFRLKDLVLICRSKPFQSVTLKLKGCRKKVTEKHAVTFKLQQAGLSVPKESEAKKDGGEEDEAVSQLRKRHVSGQKAGAEVSGTEEKDVDDMGVLTDDDNVEGSTNGTMTDASSHVCGEDGKPPVPVGMRFTLDANNATGFDLYIAKTTIHDKNLGIHELLDINLICEVPECPPPSRFSYILYRNYKFTAFLSSVVWYWFWDGDINYLVARMFF